MKNNIISKAALHGGSGAAKNAGSIALISALAASAGYWRTLIGTDNGHRQRNVRVVTGRAIKANKDLRSAVSLRMRLSGEY